MQLNENFAAIFTVYHVLSSHILYENVYVINFYTFPLKI